MSTKDVIKRLEGLLDPGNYPNRECKDKEAINTAVSSIKKIAAIREVITDEIPYKIAIKRINKILLSEVE